MPGPFPGMDPYLENHWGDVHARLIVATSNQLRTQLPRDLRARIEEQVAVTVDDQPEVSLGPDVRVVETPRESEQERGGVAIAVEASARVLVPLEPEPATERSIHIIDRTSGDRVVTTIEFLSPWNKLRRRERQRFRRKQQALLEAGVNLVEIDLVRAGGWAVSVPEGLMPQAAAYPFRFCVIRGHDSLQAECYLNSLQQRLPVIDIPLRPTDADVKLDVQKLIDLAWEEGDYGDLEYERETLPRFTPADTDWVRERIMKRQSK
jgi:hypothetical protein